MFYIKHKIYVTLQNLLYFRKYLQHFWLHYSLQHLHTHAQLQCTSVCWSVKSCACILIMHTIGMHVQRSNARQKLKIIKVAKWAKKWITGRKYDTTESCTKGCVTTVLSRCAAGKRSALIQEENCPYMCENDCLTGRIITMWVRIQRMWNIRIKW